MAKNTRPRRRKAINPDGPIEKRGYKLARPVLSVRVPQIVFDDISAEANAQNISLTDVVYRRLLAYQRFEQIDWGTFGERLKAHVEAHPELIDRIKDEWAKTKASPEFQGDRDAAWQQIERRDIEADLRKLGYTRLAGPGGALWAEPGASIPASIVKALTEPKAAAILDESST
jgi:hypothetical protein